MRLAAAFVLLSIACAAPAPIRAQAAPAFEVASVKPQPWQDRGSFLIMVRGNTLDAEHMDLAGLIEFAYNVKDDDVLGGPAWARHGLLISSDLYQVIAKAAGDPPPPMAQFRLMLQALLAERFQLKVHHVSRERPIYNLVAAKHGPKLKASAGDEKFQKNVDGRLDGGRTTRMTARHVSVAQLMDDFAIYARRPVRDHTGLTGFYDFELEWAANPLGGAAPDAVIPETGGVPFPAALEKQLGLKLESATAMFDAIVIDHAEKPSAN